MLANTPLTSYTEGNILNLGLNESSSRQKTVGRKMVQKDRAKAYRELKKQKEENEKTETGS